MWEFHEDRVEIVGPTVCEFDFEDDIATLGTYEHGMFVPVQKYKTFYTAKQLRQIADAMDKEKAKDEEH